MVVGIDVYADLVINLSVKRFVEESGFQDRKEFNHS